MLSGGEGAGEGESVALDVHSSESLLLATWVLRCVHIIAPAP